MTIMMGIQTTCIPETEFAAQLLTPRETSSTGILYYGVVYAMTDSDTLPFYNYLGQIEYLPSFPLSFGDWSPSTGEPLSAEQQSLIDYVFRILHKSPTESHIRAENINLASN
jgi:hypothetical protein